MEVDVLEPLLRLKSILDRLRSPGGCPWDLEQTSGSLKPYLLEEAHEVAEAIEQGEPVKLCEELGDLLMNIFLQARIAEEEQRFTLGDVADAISDKLVRRHPHVFGDGDASTSDEVRRRWEEIKAEEKGQSGEPASALRALPASLPALLHATRLGAMAAEVGFDWPDAGGPLAKIEEELGELRAAVSLSDVTAAGSEIGDLLFATASLARHLDVDPEQALRATLERFRSRFRVLERRRAGRHDLALDELEALWQEAKRELEPGADDAET